jgi:hypothetical protein
MAHRIYPKSSVINNHGPALYQDQFFTRSFQIVDSRIALDYVLNFTNYSYFQIFYNELYTYLYFAWAGTLPIPEADGSSGEPAIVTVT